MAGRKSREKGARGEREAAQILCQIGVIAERNGRNGVESGSDLKVDGLPIHFEVKCQAKPAPGRAIHQAIKDAPDGHVPAVLHRQVSEGGNQHTVEPWLVTIRALDLPQAVNALLEYYRQQMLDNRKTMDQAQGSD